MCTRNSQITCGICFEKTTESTQTPCSHNFCNKCLTQWLMFNTSCPTCRYPIGINNKESILNEEDHYYGSYTCSIETTISMSENITEKIKTRVHDLISYILNDEIGCYTHKWKFNTQDYSTTIIKNNMMYIISVDIIELINQNNLLVNPKIIIDISIDYNSQIFFLS